MATKDQIMNSGLVVSEVFQHESLGGFDVTAMRQWALETGLPITMVQIDEALIVHIRQARDVDTARVWNLKRTEWKRDPAMCVIMGNEHLLIDGVHRILRRAAEGLKDFPCWFVPMDKVIRPRPIGEDEYKAEWGSFQMDEQGKIYNDKRDK